MLSPIATPNSNFLFEYSDFPNDYEIISIDELLGNSTVVEYPETHAIITTDLDSSSKSDKRKLSDDQNNLKEDHLRSPDRSGKFDGMFNIDTNPIASSTTTPSHRSGKGSSKSWKTSRPPTTPTPKASRNTASLLKSKNAADRVCAKRPHWNDQDFPPMSMATTTPGSGSGKRLHSNSHSCNNLSALNPSNPTTPFYSSLLSYTFPYYASNPDATLSPAFITDRQLLMTESAYFSSEIPLVEIISGVDNTLKEIAGGSQESHLGSSLTSSLSPYYTIYQQMYVYYDVLDYSWRLLFSHAGDTCELKLQIYQLIRESEVTPSTTTTTTITAEKCDGPTTTFYEEAKRVPPYVVVFQYLEGDRTLFQMIYQQIKEAVSTTEPSWEKDETLHCFSKCLVLSPQDYYYDRHKKSDATTSSSTSYCTTPQHSSSNNHHNNNGCSETSSSGKLKYSPSISSLSRMDTSTAMEFFAIPANREVLLTWIGQIVAFDRPAEQSIAIQQISHLVNASYHEKELLSLLESEQLIDNLMTIFRPIPSMADSTIVPLPGTSSRILFEHEDDVYGMKPMIVQILLYFTEREVAVKTMLNCSNFIEYITRVTSTFQQQEVQQKKVAMEWRITMGMTGSSKTSSTTPVVATTTPLKWLKLYRDCYRLSEEIAKMISVEDEDSRICIRRTSSEDHMFSSKFSPNSGEGSHRHYSLSSRC